MTSELDICCANEGLSGTSRLLKKRVLEPQRASLGRRVGPHERSKAAICALRRSAACLPVGYLRQRPCSAAAPLLVVRPRPASRWASPLVGPVGRGYRPSLRDSRPARCGQALGSVCGGSRRPFPPPRIPLRLASESAGFPHNGGGGGPARQGGCAACWCSGRRAG